MRGRVAGLVDSGRPRPGHRGSRSRSRPFPSSRTRRFYPGRPPLPGTIYAADNRGEIRIQRLGDRIWLVVPEPPTTVWPKIKQFLADNGVAVGVPKRRARGGSPPTG